jgi:hypothetical protein
MNKFEEASIKIKELQNSGENGILDRIMQTMGFSEYDDFSNYILTAEDDDTLTQFDTLYSQLHSVTAPTLQDLTVENLIQVGNKLGRFYKKTKVNFAKEGVFKLPHNAYKSIAELLCKYSEYENTRTVFIDKNGKIYTNANLASTLTDDSVKDVGIAHSNLLNNVVEHARKYSKNAVEFQSLALLYNSISNLLPNGCNQQNALQVADILEKISTEDAYEGDIYVYHFTSKFDNPFFNSPEGEKFFFEALERYGKDAENLLKQFDSGDVEQILERVKNNGLDDTLQLLMGQESPMEETNIDTEESFYTQVQHFLYGATITVLSANLAVDFARLARTPSTEKMFKLVNDGVELYILYNPNPYSLGIKLTEAGYYFYNGEYYNGFYTLGKTALISLFTSASPTLSIAYGGIVLVSSSKALADNIHGLIEECITKISIPTFKDDKFLEKIEYKHLEDANDEPALIDCCIGQCTTESAF